MERFIGRGIMDKVGEVIERFVIYFTEKRRGLGVCLGLYNLVRIVKIYI